MRNSWSKISKNNLAQ